MLTVFFFPDMLLCTRAASGWVPYLFFIVCKVSKVIKLLCLKLPNSMLINLILQQMNYLQQWNMF